jgi:hypothetical protein
VYACLRACVVPVLLQAVEWRRMYVPHLSYFYGWTLNFSNS